MLMSHYSSFYSMHVDICVLAVLDQREVGFQEGILSLK